MSSFLLIAGAVVGGMVIGALILGVGMLLLMRSRRAVVPPLPAAMTDNLESPTSLKPDAVKNPSAPEPPTDLYVTLDSIKPAPQNVPWFDGVGGVVAGQRIPIVREELIIGRSRVCDIQFPDPKVSRQHAMVRLYRGRYFIQDMQSSRGTLVNSQSIQTHHLQEGDQIRLGDTVLVFRVPKSADPN